MGGRAATTRDALRTGADALGQDCLLGVRTLRARMAASAVASGRRGGA